MRTKSAVARLRWPPSSRSPTATATRATEMVASSSRMSEDRNATFSVAMVAVRYWSVMSRIAATWALARPKTLSVGRPATTSRKWPARRWRSRPGAPSGPWSRRRPSAMNTGISGTVTAMITAEIQSAPSTTTMTVDRDDHRQEQLRQVAGEVAVEGVDPAGGQHDQPSRALPVDAGGSEARRSARPERSAGRTSPMPRPGRPSAPGASPPPPGRR